MSQHCSICRIGEEAGLIVPGPVVSLCQQCLGLIASKMLEKTQNYVERPTDWSEDKRLYCCFCGESNHEAQLLVELNDITHDCICSKCVIDCVVYLLPSLPKHGTPVMLQQRI